MKTNNNIISVDIFELEQSTDCENDYLEVRQAITVDPSFPKVRFAGTYGPILSIPVSVILTSPARLKALTGNTLWLHFKSDNIISITYKGFKASCKAGVYENRIVVQHSNF